MMGITLIPYVLSDGAWSIPDSTMRLVWREMESRGLDRVVFYSGGMNEENFLRFAKSSGNVVHTIWEEDGLDMIAWLNGFGANYAFAHFCCFPRTWGKNSVVLGRKCLDYWFGFKKDDGEPLLDVVLKFFK